MADAVTVQVTDNPAGRDMVVILTGVSDGTGETDVVKVDKSAYTVRNSLHVGAEPSKLAIVGARWNIQGYSSVRLEFDEATDVVALPMSGSGADDFTGRMFSTDFNGQGIVDNGSGGTGDIILTSVGASATATYNITLYLRKIP